MLGKVRMALSFSLWGVTSSSPALLRLEGFPRLQDTRHLRQGASPESRAQKQRQFEESRHVNDKEGFPGLGVSSSSIIDAVSAERESSFSENHEREAAISRISSGKSVSL